MLIRELVEITNFMSSCSKIVVGNGGLNSKLGFQCRSHIIMHNVMCTISSYAYDYNGSLKFVLEVNNLL